MSDAVVSVLVAAYNHAAFVEQAIRSALASTHQALQVVIVDDGSSDGTTDICRRVAASDSRCELLCQPHQGVVPTLNALLRQARGTYVAFLASDDAFWPDKIATQVAYLDTHPDVGAAFHFVRFIDGSGSEVSDGPPFNTSYAPLQLVSRMTLGNVLCATSAMARRSLTERIGEFDPALPLTHDYDYWLRLMRAAPVHLLPHVLGAYRVHAQNLSGKNIPAAAHETWNVIVRHAEALAVRYAPAVQLDVAFFEALVSIAYQAGDWDACAELSVRKRRLFGAAELDILRLLACYLRLGRAAAARGLLDELRAEKRAFGSEAQKMVDQVTHYLAASGQ